MNPVYIIPSYFSKIHYKLTSHLHLGLPSGLLPSGFPTKILYAFLFSQCMLNTLSISSSLTWSFWLYMAKSTSYEASHYAIVSTFLLFHTFEPRYFPQHPVLKYFRSMFFIYCKILSKPRLIAIDSLPKGSTLKYIVVDFLKAFLGNGSVNNFPTCNSGSCVSVDECYS
jgi:hypothetical protein